MANYRYEQHSSSSGGTSSRSQATQKVTETSTVMPQRTVGGTDEIDSALNDLMVVSEMASPTSTSTPMVDGGAVKGKKSVRMAESHSSTHVSSGPIVTAQGVSGSSSSSFSTRQFYSYSSSSSSKQQVVSSSSGSIEYPGTSVPPTSSERIKSSSTSSASSSHQQQSKTATSSSSSANKTVDYSRINQTTTGTESLTQQQLDSPVCNFTVCIT